MLAQAQKDHAARELKAAIAKANKNIRLPYGRIIFKLYGDVARVKPRLHKLDEIDIDDSSLLTFLIGFGDLEGMSEYVETYKVEQRIEGTFTMNLFHSTADSDFPQK